MISSLNKSISFNNYKECNEQFIYAVKGIIRLPIGREIIYRIGYLSLYLIFLRKFPNIYMAECIFAVTDKRIILIPKTNEYTPISFNYGDIDVIYYDQLFDKVFLLNIKDKKLLNFCENKLVFRMYSKQNSELNKIKYVLQEYACA